MLFGRRAEGVKSLRGIFGKARRDRWVPWEVYKVSGPSLLVFLSL
jgi:cleavage stimulation factor subunit 3